jgi:hypothetical protein
VISDPHKVHLSPADVDIDDLVQAAKTSTFEVDLRNVGLTEIKVYQDLACTKICGSAEKLKGFSAGEEDTSPFYIKVQSPGSGIGYCMFVFCVTFDFCAPPVSTCMELPGFSP